MSFKGGWEDFWDRRLDHPNLKFCKILNMRPFRFKRFVYSMASLIPVALLYVLSYILSPPRHTFSFAYSRFFRKSPACAVPCCRWCPGCWGPHLWPTSAGSSPPGRGTPRTTVDIRPSTRIYRKRITIRMRKNRDYYTTGAATTAPVAVTYRRRTVKRFTF